MNISKLLLAVLAASTAASCATKEATHDIHSSVNEAANMLPTAAAPLPAVEKNTINNHSAVFVGSTSVINENGDPLPDRVEKADSIVVISATSVSLREVAGLITQKAKIPVVVAADVGVPTSAQNGSAPAAAAPAAAAPATAGAAAAGAVSSPQFASGPMPAGFPLQQALSEISSNTPSAALTAQPSASAGQMRVDFKGKLSDLLDLVATNYNVAWKYERGKIVLESTVTRSFDVPALPMVTSLGFTLGQTGTDAGGATAKTDVTVNVFDELKDALGKLVGADAFSINRSTGVVAVTGSPASVDRARQYIENLNVRLADQVALSVKVYAVTVKDEDDFALNLAGVFKDSKNSINLAGAGTAAAITGGGSLGWALVDGASQFNGSDAAVQALSTRGDVSVVTTASLTTVNGQPVPLQVGQDRDYIKEIKQEEDDNSNITTTFTPDSVSTGFALQMMPRIQRNGDVLLQYGVNIKELVGADDGFDTRVIGGNTVQLKRLNQRNFIQNANIPYGKTLVLAGFEQVRSSATNSGVGHPLFPLLGGSSNASKEREVIVIMITPTVLK